MGPKPIENKPTISACMMVKNEEEMLPDCLESIKDVVDEIIVVDTGSTDRTVEIAESYGAKIYHHPWENDFSKHRNQSISYATGDWFLIVDADERLDNERLSVSLMKQRLSELDEDIHAVLATVRDYGRKGKLKLSWKVTRLFRNHVGVHYKGFVHNQPIIKGQAVDSNLLVNHYGYDLTPDKMEKKFERTNALLQQRIQDNPKDYSAYFYLANLYGSYKRIEEAVEFGKKTIRYLPSDSSKELYLKIYYNIGAGYLTLGNYEEAKKWLYKGIESLPGDLDMHYALSLVGIKTEELDLIEEHAHAFLSSYEDWLNNEINAGLRFIYHLDAQYKNDILSNYLTALVGKNKLTKFQEIWDRYEPDISSNPRIGIHLLSNLAAMGLIGDFLEYTEKLVHSSPSEPAYIHPLITQIQEDKLSEKEFLEFVKTAIIGQGNYYLLSETINTLLHKDLLHLASELIKMVSGNGTPDGFEIAKNSLLCIRQGKSEQALRLIKQGLALSVDDQEFYLNAIPILYKFDQFQLLMESIERVLRYYDSFEDVPDIVLFPLSFRLVKENQVDFMLQITDLLCERYDISTDQVIDSWEGFAGIYDSLAQKFEQDGRSLMAQLAWEACFAMTDHGRYLELIGDIHFQNARYDEALQRYSAALDREHQSRGMFEHMKTIFGHLENAEGIAQCDELLAVYENIS